jgi:hypothetical protein
MLCEETTSFRTSCTRNKKQKLFPSSLVVVFARARKRNKNRKQQQQQHEERQQQQRQQKEISKSI